MILWLAYSIVVGALIAVAARLVERAARLFGWTTRYVWVVAMFAMLATTTGSLGFRAYEQQGARTAAATQSSQVTTGPIAADWWQSLIPAEVSASRAGFATEVAQRIDALAERLSRFDRPVFIVWALLTTFVGALVLHATLEGRRLLHASEARHIKGVRVLLTDSLGPAAVGLGATAVLMPRWALDLEDQLLDLVLRHEREHLEANDPALLLYGLVVIVLLPWQLPLWWAWQRLRLAIEVDCDARLLRGGSDTKRYAQLLLLMSQRIVRPSSALQPLITATAPLQPELSHLATRIQIMTENRSHNALGSIALLAIGVVATGSVAFAIPVPRPPAAPTVAGTAQGDGRVIVRVASVGIRDVELDSRGQIKGEILIFTRGPAKVGIGTGPLLGLKDTLHLKTMPAFTADVTDGEVHIKLMGSEKGKFSLRATVAGGPAKAFSGEDSYLVLMKGGAGIKTMAAVPPLFIVDGVKTSQETALSIPREGMASVDVLKGDMAVAKYGVEGKHGVVLISTKANRAPATPSPSVARPESPSDSTKLYFEYQVDAPVQQESGSARPTYPVAQKAAGVEGMVLAQFIVGLDGTVETGSFKSLKGTAMATDGTARTGSASDADVAAFESAVRDAVTKARYTAGKLHGNAVRQVVQQRFVFALEKK